MLFGRRFGSRMEERARRGSNGSVGQRRQLIKQKHAHAPSGRSGGSQAPRPLAQQQPFFFPDLVLTFLLPSLLFFSLPSLLFFSFLDFFLPATASAAASTAEDAASVTGATTDCTAAAGSPRTAPPMALASEWISSSVTGWPAISFWNISGEMLMRCGSAGAA